MPSKSSVSQWSGRPVFNIKLVDTIDFKNGT